VTRVALWVEASGRVTEARVVQSSGVPQLDQAAVAASPFLEFYPAMHRGVPTGTWVEFDLRFEGRGVRPGQAAAGDSGDGPDLVILGAGARSTGDDVGGEAEGDAGRIPLDGEELLMEALGGAAAAEELVQRGGSLLDAKPPAEVSQLGWRRDAASVLEAAVLRRPGNPAPYLALGRIRKQQGLNSEALRLFNVGVSRANSSRRPVPPDVVAGLHYERATLRRAEWLPWAHLGRVPVEGLAASGCTGVDPVGSADGYALALDLLRHNQFCPEQSESRLAEVFEDLSGGGDEARRAYLRDLEAAVQAYPGHAEASTALILELLDEGDLASALEWADAFVLSSGGHPHAHLLRGVALHRMEQYGVADLAFRDGLAELSATQADALRDIGAVVDAAEAARLESMEAVERTQATWAFWSLEDPVLGTPVNEALVEHLARASYGLLRFGSLETDASVAWMRYGPPDHQWSVVEGQARRVVFWDYGPGPDLTFRRGAENSELSLTD